MQSESKFTRDKLLSKFCYVPSLALIYTYNMYTCTLLQATAVSLSIVILFCVCVAMLMQVRYEQLMRQQEKMIQDMEKAVYRREAIQFK